MTRSLTALLAVLLSGLVWAVDPVFPEVKALSSTPLHAKVLNSTEKDGIVIEEIMYHSEMDGEKSVDIFAYFGYPKGGKNLPALVWNQSGLYKANTYFVELGAKRGYAVLCIDFPLPGYRSTGGYAITSQMDLTKMKLTEPFKEPIARGVVALLKAVTYLESRPEVDKQRIGMAGSSWGGFYTTLMAGIDARLKAASCFFGTGNLHLGSSWFGSNPEAKQAALWGKTLDPAWRLANTRVPINWCSGTNDFGYWMPSLMQTYDTSASTQKRLALLPNWNHSLTESLDEQVFAFLDIHLQGKPDFPRLREVTIEKTRLGLFARWRFSCPPERTVKAVEVIASFGPAGNWPGRAWLTIPGKIVEGACIVELPQSKLPFVISATLIDNDNYRHSSPLMEVDPAKQKFLGMQMPSVDGCVDWGSFEKEQLEIFVGRHGYPGVSTSTDAKTGVQSALLKAGRNAFPPVLFTPGVTNRFTCYLKSADPAEVTVQLSGTLDGKPVALEQKVTAGKDWTLLTIDYPLATAKTISPLSLVVTTPANSKVLLDAVSFSPVETK